MLTLCSSRQPSNTSYGSKCTLTQSSVLCLGSITTWTGFVWPPITDVQLDWIHLRERTWFLVFHIHKCTYELKPSNFLSSICIFCVSSIYLSNSVTDVWGRTLGINRQNNSGFNVAYSEKEKYDYMLNLI